jgi:hypothetical protein
MWHGVEVCRKCHEVLRGDIDQAIVELKAINAGNAAPFRELGKWMQENPY